MAHGGSLGSRSNGSPARDESGPDDPELDQEPRPRRRSAARCWRVGGVEVVVELDQEHAGEVGRGGDR
jgi:hypothetical protein